MARIIRSTRTWPRRATAAAVGVAGSGVLAIGAWWAFARHDAPQAQAAGAPAAAGHQAAVPPLRPELTTTPVAAPPAIALERVEVAPSGTVAAVLRVDGGPSRRHVQGDALAVGVRLARIGADRIDVDAQGRTTTVRLPPGAQPPRLDALRAPARPAPLVLPAPPTPAVAQILDAPSPTGVVQASPDRANPVRDTIDRQVVAEALRLSTH